MSLDIRTELKIWSVYILTVFISIYIHEIGHCIPAWIEGVRAIPTLAKEYIMEEIPYTLKQNISLGGFVATVLFSLIIILWYLLRSSKYGSAILAGAIAVPGLYTLRFIVVGRGHDATEFQEVQSALGLTYSGHSLDWIYLILTLVGVVAWILKSKPNYKITVRLLIGLVITIVIIGGLQEINNAIFDPLFQ